MSFHINDKKNMEISPRKIFEKIRRFRSLNFSKMTTSEISHEIMNVLCFNGVFALQTNILVYPKGSYFFRVRRLKGSNLPNENLKTEADFWNPPSEVIHSYGRLNRPYESLLYTSPIPITAIDELKIVPNEYLALIKYKAKEDIKVNSIGHSYNNQEIDKNNEDILLIQEIYNDFLKDEFSRDVGVGTEYLYKISEIIAKDYFDLPPKAVQDAWQYISVQDKNSYNVAFRPEIAKELLSLQGAAICCLNADKFILAKCIANGFNSNGEALFHHIGSDIQKSYFPEINSY